MKPITDFVWFKQHNEITKRKEKNREVIQSGGERRPVCGTTASVASP
jgi:hypothetical protein